MPFLLKDLKKRDQIVAKLATLPNLWTTYIHRREVAAVVAPTIVYECFKIEGNGQQTLEIVFVFDPRIECVPYPGLSLRSPTKFFI